MTYTSRRLSALIAVLVFKPSIGQDGTCTPPEYAVPGTVNLLQTGFVVHQSDFKQELEKHAKSANDHKNNATFGSWSRFWEFDAKPDKALPGLVLLSNTAFTATHMALAVILIGGVVLFFTTEKNREAWLAPSIADLPTCADSRPRELATALNTHHTFTDGKVLQDFIPDIDEPFVLAVDGRQPLTYAQLRALLSSNDVDVSRFGVSGSDRLATILGDGPEFVVAFWVFSAKCAVCPINHKASDEEIYFTLQDLPAKAVVLRKEDNGRASGCPIIEYTAHSTIVGLFSLAGAEVGNPPPKEPPTSSSIAIVLQTSGTTKKPKQVPLSHQNLMICGSNLAEMIQLEPGDRGLNMLPLFHVGGIMNSIIAPVLSKSSVVCGGPFVAASAFGWILEHRPTWYFGSPTIHMMLMKEQMPPKEQILRCVRNATSALLPSIAAEMDEFWKNCEVLPGYGMTECTPIASHQFGKTAPLASSGPGAGVEIRVDGSGEICIKGPAVFSGYQVRSGHMDEDPNMVAFEGGWFRTGDTGSLSKDGFLTINGRCKEIIIRGGENISPFEVEDSLNGPQFAALMAFSIRHMELGEVVGLAVVTHLEGATLIAALKALKEGTKLDHRRFPQVIVKMDKLPTTRAGKLQRIGLQSKLGLPDLSIDNPSPFAYTYADGTLKALKELPDFATAEVDSLGLSKRAGAVKIQDHVEHGLMCTYGALSFMVMVHHVFLFVDFTDLSSNAIPAMLMLKGNVQGSVKWTMQGFTAIASYFNSTEPFQPARFFVLLVAYFGYPFFNTIAIEANRLVSGEMGDGWQKGWWVDKRWYLGMLIISYVAFSLARRLPFKGLQCFFLLCVTMVLFVTHPSEYALHSIAPPLVKTWFGTHGNNGWHLHSACVMVYFVVGHYGHDAQKRIEAHPFIRSSSFQWSLSIACPIIFIASQLALFYNPLAMEAQTNGKGHHFMIISLGAGPLWETASFILFELSGACQMILLSLTLRNGPKCLATVGRSALGIFLFAGNIFYDLPQNYMYFFSAPPGHYKGSFAFFVHGIPVIPPLQDALAWARVGALQWAIIVVYVVFQMVVIGIPCHYLYLSAVKVANDWLKRIGMARIGPGSPPPSSSAKQSSA
jgi:acyl-CoA synthetase (AMP-forming)/AMP-acid ligase II